MRFLRKGCNGKSGQEWKERQKQPAKPEPAPEVAIGSHGGNSTLIRAKATAKSGQRA